MVQTLDEPLADPVCVITNLIARAARQHGIKVMLSGVGGDDLLSGYRRHSAATFNAGWEHLPINLRRSVAAYAAGSDQSHGQQRRIAKVLKTIALDRDSRIMTLFEWSSAARVQSLLNREMMPDVDLVYAPFQRELANHPDIPDLEKCLRLDRRFFLADHNLMYTDKMGMAAGVEIRVPLLDLELVEFASHIPAEWKHRGVTAKWLFKRSQRGLVPDAVRTRPKSGFGVPLRSWISGGLRDMAHDLMSTQSLQSRGIFDPKGVQKLMQDTEAGRDDATYTLFSVMCIELWCRSFQDSVALQQAA